MNLKSMSLDRLANLRGQVEAALVAKVADQRCALEFGALKNQPVPGWRSKDKVRAWWSKGIIRRPQISQSGKCYGNLGGPRIEAPMVDGRTQVRKEARRLRHCGWHGALKTSNAACGESKGIIRRPQISQSGKCYGNLGGPRIEAPMVDAAIKSGKNQKTFALQVRLPRQKPMGGKKLAGPASDVRWRERVQRVLSGRSPPLYSPGSFFWLSYGTVDG